MNNKWLVVTLASALLGSAGAAAPATSASAAPVVLAAAANTVGEIKAMVNFRESPSTSGARIRYLRQGELVDVIREVNAYWLEVRDSAGVTGYVSSLDKYVELRAVSSPPAANANGSIIATVSLRAKPSTSGERIRYLKAGETVHIVEKAGAYWFKVIDASGTTGYVSSSETYIRTSFGAKQPQDDAPNGQVRASVSFRTGPSTSNARIRYLQKGELIRIVEQVNSAWYKAYDSSNTLGYVSTQTRYIDTMFNESSNGEEPIYEDEPNGIVLKSVSLRTGPSTSHSRIRYLQANEPVWILDKPNGYWYYIQDKNNTQGFVSTNAQYIAASYEEEHVQIDPAEAVERTIEAGLAYLGTPYEFGSSRSDTSTFDCSDFVRQAFLDGIGLRIPGDSRSQGTYVKESGNTVVTDWKKLKRGDLIFFMDYKGYRAADYAGIDKNKERISHVALYLGNGQILHTYSVSSGGVRVDELSGTQWELRMLYGGSALGSASAG